MNVLIVSQCSKKALTETRRIVDQFAERCGERTWQTPITQQGLDTLKKLLRRSARRNTAVACHWLRGKNRSELLWIVGKASLFNAQGAVPTNVTTRDILKQHDEHNWHTLQGIKILAAIAALFHDFGKASAAFQAKLKNPNEKIKDAYRHEWVSLRLFQAFVADAAEDEIWLTRLAQLPQAIQGETEKKCLTKLLKDGISDRRETAKSPFASLPPVAQAVGWLILSHHFLPQRSTKDENKTEAKKKKLAVLLTNLAPEWNNANPESSSLDQKEKCWNFEDNKLPFSSTKWRVRASAWAQQALNCPDFLSTNWLNDLFSLHLARLSLMLADHHYSSLPANPHYGDVNFPLYANTQIQIDSQTNKRTSQLKQRLDEHLIGVAHHARHIALRLPYLEREMQGITHKKAFCRRSDKPAFYWQDQAFDLSNSLRDTVNKQGFFGINMASTGCGKTFANARIMYALADEKRGARFCVALGLRVLTLQTGEAYRKRLELDSDELAILVGAAAIKDLFDSETQNSEKDKNAKEQAEILAASGSESIAELLPEELEIAKITYKGSTSVAPLQRWLEEKKKVKQLLAAPVLVCTIDHLISATEGTRGGKQILPMLRLLTSDLVLDEPDDFDVADLPALARLVHWAGMLSSKVLLSSATLPPALVAGLFNAYQQGRKLFLQARGEPNQTADICCAWFDENTCTASTQIATESFTEAHSKFVQQRCVKLQQTKVIRRRAVIKPLPIHAAQTIHQATAQTLHSLLHELHQQHHTIDPITHKRVSFGLIRFANIDPLISVAKELFKLGALAEQRIFLCCYHARFPLFLRDRIEKNLDRLLNRSKPLAVFNDPAIREILNNNSNESDFIFVVLASPVAEVGRDHDYDWAIVEPSSMRSIIQLAGRVKRHRDELCIKPNIYLLNNNLKYLKNNNDKIATFCKPGFENVPHFLLNSHQLEKVLLPEQYEQINAIPRIQPRAILAPNENLVDLEHARLQALLLEDKSETEICANWWWQTAAPLTGVLQRATRFREDSLKERYVRLPEDEEDNKQNLQFFYLDKLNNAIKANQPFHEINNLAALKYGDRILPWLTCEDGKAERAALQELAIKKGLSLTTCAKRFAFVELRLEKNGDGLKKWCYHPVLGLGRMD